MTVGMNNPAPMGHNASPVTPPNMADVKADIETRYPEVQTRLDELVASAQTAPDRIDDDETDGKVQTLIKEMVDTRKAWEDMRDAEKAPWQRAADTIYNFFKKAEDVLQDGRGKTATGWIPKLKARHTDYLERKAEAKRIEDERRAAEERKRAEEAAREAALLEERRRAAEEAEKDKAAALAEAKENVEADLQRGLDAKAALATAKAERARARRDKDEDAIARADAAVAAAEAEIAFAREELSEKRRIQREAKEAAEKAARDADAKARESAKATAAAERQERTATTAETKAEKSTGADLSRTRGDYTVGTLSGRWEVRVEDFSKIPLQDIKGYFLPDHIEAALYRFMRDHQKDWEAHKRDRKAPKLIDGVEFIYVAEGRVS